MNTYTIFENWRRFLNESTEQYSAEDADEKFSRILQTHLHGEPIPFDLAVEFLGPDGEENFNNALRATNSYFDKIMEELDEKSYRKYLMAVKPYEKAYYAIFNLIVSIDDRMHLSEIWDMRIAKIVKLLKEMGFLPEHQNITRESILALSDSEKAKFVQFLYSARDEIEARMHNARNELPYYKAETIKKFLVRT